jgi:formylmethanofuran dehydrogenase subunit E
MKYVECSKCGKLMVVRNLPEEWQKPLCESCESLDYILERERDESPRT